MKFDSIKSRLLLMTLICVLGMATLVTSQHIINQQLIAMNQQKEALIRLEGDLLQLRRHEKDFLLRGQLRYVNKFSQGITSFEAALDSIQTVYTAYGLDAAKAAEIDQTIRRYNDLFMQVVAINRRIGLSEDVGLRNDFDKTVKTLKASTQSLNALHQLTLAQLAHRDMLLNYNMQLTSDFTQSVNSLSPRLFSRADAQQQLQSLVSTFDATADLLQQMGETEGEGLRGEFRRQAHLLESRLASIDDKLKPLILEQEDRIRLYSLLIAIATCLLLVFILVKSFATFHRAFSYFVMFFYQCKREFQHIDPKKLGFAEFKSLAELANEMVESRKDAERQLAEAKRQLKEQQNN
jgi:hypothetical protein